MKFIALFLALAFPFLARADMATLDAKASSLKFTGHAFLHNFSGQAQDFDGFASTDPANPNFVTEAYVSVATAGMTTFQKTRDKNMHDWLHGASQLFFHLTRVTLVSGDPVHATADHPARFTVSGDFQLNGATKPLTASVTGWRERQTLVVDGATKIDTVSYGLPIIKQLFMTVDKDVDVSFHLVFDLPPAAAMKR